MRSITLAAVLVCATAGLCAEAQKATEPGVTLDDITAEPIRELL